MNSKEVPVEEQVYYNVMKKASDPYFEDFGDKSGSGGWILKNVSIVRVVFVPIWTNISWQWNVKIAHTNIEGQISCFKLGHIELICLEIKHNQGVLKNNIKKRKYTRIRTVWLC